MKNEIELLNDHNFTFDQFINDYEISIFFFIILNMRTESRHIKRLGNHQKSNRETEDELEQDILNIKE